MPRVRSGVRLRSIPKFHMITSGARPEKWGSAKETLLGSEISGVRAVAPTASRSIQAIYGNANWSTTVYGIDDNYFDVRNWTIDSGREFTDAEMQTGAAVCIVGAKVRKQLFLDQEIGRAHV